MIQSEDNVHTQPPSGVKFIAIIFYAIAALGALNLVNTVYSSSDSISEYENLVQPSKMKVIFNVLWAVGAVVMYYLVGRNLWVGKSWARIAAIILCFIGIAESIYMLLAVPDLALFANTKAIACILIPFYLLLNNRTIDYFRAAKRNEQIGNNKASGVKSPP